MHDSVVRVDLYGLVSKILEVGGPLHGQRYLHREDRLRLGQEGYIDLVQHGLPAIEPLGLLKGGNGALINRASYATTMNTPPPPRHHRNNHHHTHNSDNVLTPTHSKK